MDDSGVPPRRPEKEDEVAAIRNNEIRIKKSPHLVVRPRRHGQYIVVLSEALPLKEGVRNLNVKGQGPTVSQCYIAPTECCRRPQTS